MKTALLLRDPAPVQNVQSWNRQRPIQDKAYVCYYDPELKSRDLAEILRDASQALARNLSPYAVLDTLQVNPGAWG